MNDAAFYKRLYRLNADESEDWRSAVSLVEGDDDQPRRPTRSPTDALQRNYLKVVLQAGNFYSVPLPTQCDDPGGLPAGEEETYFQVMSVHSGGQRAKVLQVLAKDEQDVAREAELAVNLQYLQTWSRRSPELVTAFFDSDPVFTSALNIAPYHLMRTRLLQWSGTVSDTRGCHDLSAPRSTVPTLALTDDGVPTCMVIEHLRELGFVPMNGRVIHKDMKLEMDGRKPESRLVYFQTLVRLRELLEHNQTIHSDQPTSYYQCVQQCYTVDANLGDKHYRLRLTMPRDSVLALPAPPPLDVPAIADGVADDGFDVIGSDESAHEVRPRQRKARAKPALPFPAAPLLPIGPAEPSSSSSSSSGSNATSANSMFDMVGERSRVTDWITIFDGAPRMKLDSYKPAGKRRYQRFIAECTWHGADCVKRRNSNLTESYGQTEPIAYLVAWNAMGEHCDKAAHKIRGFDVPAVNVARCVGQVGSKATPLIDKLVS
jgi:hypothetical protein